MAPKRKPRNALPSVRALTPEPLRSRIPRGLEDAAVTVWLAGYYEGERVGSEALAKTKAEMFQMTLDTWLSDIGDVVNTHALPRLWAINGLPEETMPTFRPAPVAQGESGRSAERHLPSRRPAPG